MYPYPWAEWVVGWNGRTQTDPKFFLVVLFIITECTKKRRKVREKKKNNNYTTEKGEMGNTLTRC